jgi:uncharacterized tellurite resistance protein B-like protein
VNADGSINEKEIQSGAFLAKSEGVAEQEFIVLTENLKKRKPSVIYSESIEELKKHSREVQIRCVAWLCLIANADGFMDKTEWQFIYKLYKADLNLELDEVMNMQKVLMKLKEKKT